MKLDEVLSKAHDAVSARRVYAEPVEADGVTVIPAAAVGGGGGGGQGHDQKGQEGEGGGVGVGGRPVGAYTIKNSTVRWLPAVDVNRLVVAVASVLVVYLLTRARIAKARAAKRA
ncbi:spore germination protein GerW family protein [Saccharomonospora sp. NPDC046836]|uniref:spore germination protein GerW family protein n=1 Tax=Saccharomonospora sp. NPDC046836 TaxID=3156921 RepID=UPI0033C08C30